ncbi:putative mannosylphosphorylation protein [Venturia nashicola]|nr:putative mannosylphosphorylation protein [Venturia nashicola]
MLLRLPVQILLTFSYLTQATPLLRKRDADFASVRTRLTKDHSGKGGDPADKYFHESTFHPHYDGRFAAQVLPDSERKIILTNLMQTYLSTMNDIGAETWIMHGSLLGWWWNRKIMPWDSDVDVQMSENSMDYLAKYYNMTIHHYRLPGIPKGRDYMLEVNPHYVNGSITDWLNVIDARWIDTDSGLFIDITTLRKNGTEGGNMYCKDQHNYRAEDIFPLRDSHFENTPVKIPYAYTELLEVEYGPQALTETKFEHHTFDEEKMEWVPDGDHARDHPGAVPDSNANPAAVDSVNGNTNTGA